MYNPLPYMLHVTFWKYFFNIFMAAMLQQGAATYQVRGLDGFLVQWDTVLPA